MLASRLERYIFRRNLRMFLLVMLVITSIIWLVDTIEQIRTIGTRAELSLAEAIYLSALKLPMLIEQILPFTLLIAAILAYRQMSLQAELIVIRASGLSAWRFLSPICILAGLVGLITMMVISPLGANLAKQFENERAQLLNQEKTNISATDAGLWMSEGDAHLQRIIHAKSMDATGNQLRDVKIFEERRGDAKSVSTGSMIKRRLNAEQATLEKGSWKLETVREIYPDQSTITYSQMSLQTELRPDDLMDGFLKPRTVTFWSLPDFIRRFQLSGLDATPYQLRWYGLITLPVLFAAMALIGALAGLRLARLGNIAVQAGFALSAGLILFVSLEITKSLALNGLVAVWLAAWIPPLLGALSCLLLLAYREDG